MTTGKVVPGDAPGILSAWGPLAWARRSCRAITRAFGRPRQFQKSLLSRESEQLNILQTVVFSDHTRAVCMKLTRRVLLRKDAQRQLEFLMVKLLRVYGECLGTKKR